MDPKHDALLEQQLREGSRGKGAWMSSEILAVLADRMAELRLLRELEKNRRAAIGTPFTDLQGHIDLHEQEDGILAAIDRHREGR